MFAGGFDFSFPVVDRFDGSGVDVDAGGKVFLQEGAGDFAGFGEGGAGDEDETELGDGGHSVDGIVADFDLGGEEGEKITQSSRRAQRVAEKRERKRPYDVSMLEAQPLSGLEGPL